MGRRSEDKRARLVPALIAAATLGISFRLRHLHHSGGGVCNLSFGEYEGPKYATDQTLASKCLVQNKWMRLMQHSVRIDGMSSSLITDWLFVDYHDRINVLVEDDRGGGDAVKRYQVLKQTKYALDRQESYAVVGGIIEPGEEASVAALREVREEMGMVCNKLFPLGRFRTDVNRGMGWVNSFVARDCRHGGKTADRRERKGENAVDDEVGAADTERQDLISLTVDELRDAAQSGRFVEVQWSNTVALALLHE